MIRSRYPDLSDLFAKRAEGRRVLAQMTVAQKLELLDRLKKFAALVKAARGKNSGKSASFV